MIPVREEGKIYFDMTLNTYHLKRTLSAFATTTI